MDQFSLRILQRTVELAIEAIPPDDNPEMVDSVVTIRDYISSPGSIDDRQLLTAILELLEISEHHSQLLIAGRLTSIARQLGWAEPAA